MDKISPTNKLVNNVIKEAEKEIYEEIVKTAKAKLKNILREKAKVTRLLKNIDREILEIKLEIGHDLEE